MMKKLYQIKKYGNTNPELTSGDIVELEEIQEHKQGCPYGSSINKVCNCNKPEPEPELILAEKFNNLDKGKIRGTPSWMNKFKSDIAETHFKRSFDKVFFAKLNCLKGNEKSIVYKVYREAREEMFGEE